jgi:hypothetical protein
MAVKAISYKNWCTDNISPQCWPRLLLKSLTLIREQGLSLKQLQEPDADLDIPPVLMAEINKSLEELYETRIEEGVLNLY